MRARRGDYDVVMGLEHQALIDRMVDEQLRARDIDDPQVLDAMRRVPRHRFVDESPAAAYGDHALPTAAGQTISQPYIVGKMTQLLGVEPGMKVLEIGTGSGYQTLVLATLGARVVSIERYDNLAARARSTLNEIAPDVSIQIVTGDGTLGYPSEAPYDRILCTAAAPDLPEPYRAQLSEGGRIVIPIGDRRTQYLTVFERHGRGWTRQDGIACRFVPLIGDAGWDETLS